MSDHTDKSEFEITQELITKSEDEFEKKITYIAAGALLLSLTFIEKVIQIESSTGKLFLVLSWIFLICTLITNLVSHLVVKIHLRKVQQEITDKLDYETRVKNHRKRIFISESFNWTSVSLLIAGIAMIIVFASHNALNPPLNKDNKSQCHDTLNIRIINSKSCEYELKSEN